MATYFKPYVSTTTSSQGYGSAVRGALSVNFYTAPSNRYAIIYCRADALADDADLKAFGFKNNSLTNIKAEKKYDVTGQPRYYLGDNVNDSRTILVLPGQSASYYTTITGSTVYDASFFWTIVEFET